MIAFCPLEVEPDRKPISRLDNSCLKQKKANIPTIYTHTNPLYTYQFVSGHFVNKTYSNITVGINLCLIS